MLQMVAEAPIKRARGPEVPLLLRLKARTLYLNGGHSYKAICEQTGITYPALKQMAHKEGWTVVRRKQEETLVAKQDAQGCAIREQVLEQINSESVELAAESMKRIRLALERGDKDAAKDFQAYTSGAKNLVSINRAISAPSAGTDQGSTTLNVFIARVGDNKPEKSVQAIDV